MSITYPPYASSSISRVLLSPAAPLSAASRLPYAPSRIYDPASENCGDRASRAVTDAATSGFQGPSVNRRTRSAAATSVAVGAVQAAGRAYAARRCAAVRCLSMAGSAAVRAFVWASA